MLLLDIFAHSPPGSHHHLLGGEKLLFHQAAFFRKSIPPSEGEEGNYGDRQIFLLI